MAKSKKKTDKPDRQDYVVSVAAGADSDKDIDVGEERNVDDFRELFGDGDEEITVGLYRTEPRYDAKGSRITGFLGPLEPGDDIDTIRMAHGGGRYQLKQRINGKYAAQRHLRVSGDPKPVRSLPVEDASAPVDKSAEELVRVNVGGVDMPLTSDVNKIKEMMLYVRMLKTAFPDPPAPPDINDTLLKLVIEGHRDPDVLDQVDKLTAVFDRMKSISSEGGGETNLLDIGREAIKAFSGYVETAGARGARGGLTVMPKVAKKAQIAAPGAGPTQDEARANPERTQGEPGETGLNNGGKMDIMTYQQIAEKAGSYIVQGYIADPQQTPADTARVLDAVVPVPESERPELAAYKDVLCLVAKNILSNQVETSAEDIEKFRLYFNNVFDIFTSTENLKPGKVSNESPKN